MRNINWNIPDADVRIISQIVDRASELYDLLDIKDTRSTITMDLTACHLNGNPLDLQRLLDAPDHVFGHDVLGIRSHINRQTGRLEDCFVPRCSKGE